MQTNVKIHSEYSVAIKVYQHMYKKEQFNVDFCLSLLPW